MATQRKTVKRPARPGGKTRPAAKKPAAKASSKAKPTKAAVNPARVRPVAKKPVAKAAPKRSAPVVAQPVAAARPSARVRANAPAMAVRSAPARATARTSAPPVRTSAPSPRIVPAQVAQPLTDQDLKEFEQRLLEERNKVLREMGHLESTVLGSNPRDSSGDLSGYTFHMADVGTDAMEREKAFQFASVEGRLLLEINTALRRLYQGRYGFCESCGQPIARARLEAVPHARLCVACKEKEERAARGML
jgi:RNA polymerase-binding protein DksA